MNCTKSCRRVTVLAVFICLAAVVDVFLVPQLQSHDDELPEAVVIGSAFAVIAAWFWLFLSYQLVKLYKKR